MVEIGKAGSWFESKFTWPRADHQLKEINNGVNVSLLDQFRFKYNIYIYI